MSINRVQFQKGLSMAEFFERYGNEEQCHAALVALRWPGSFARTAVARNTARSCAKSVGIGSAVPAEPSSPSPAARCSRRPSCRCGDDSWRCT